MSTSLRKKSKEMAGCLLLFMTLLLLLALLTYRAEDSSWNVSTSTVQTGNFFGKLGAIVSDSLFHLFGYGAFLLAIPLAVASLKLIRGRSFTGYFSHWTGIFLLLLSVGGLFESMGLRAFGQVNFTSGGVVGAAVRHILVYYMNTGGAVMLLAAVLIIGLLLLIPRTLSELGDKFHQIRQRHGVTVSADGPGTMEAPDDVAAASTVPEEVEEEPVAAFRPEARVYRGEKTERSAATGTPASTPSQFHIPITHLELREEPPAEPDVQVSHHGRKSTFRLPSLPLLDAASSVAQISQSELMEKAQQIIRKYSEFGIDGSIDAIHPGPVVTLFEYKPAPGVKYSKMVSLVDDLCLGLRAESIRIDRIPGKSTVGIEVPNSQRQTIHIREVLESKEFLSSRSPLSLALGKRINGDVYLTDLAKMPHLLVAGATGAGKSVGLNTMITSILFKCTPDEVKFIFIDPKRLELGMYADIPHLMTPIVTDAKVAANTLIWTVHEMEERYKLLAKYAVKDIDSFNRLSREYDELDTLPYIVVVIDEFAELLSVASKEVELCLQRLAQMARAVGIHLILATQRPSVEVVTGVIKANFPSRISFRLLSKHDSKTILDTVGAEHLLGKGDMLFLPPNSAKLIRVHGAFISEEETKKLVEFLKNQAEPEYLDLVPPNGDAENGGDSVVSGDDPLYEEVARFVVKNRKASTSVLQRRFRIGYGRAARLMDILEEEGIVGEALGSRPREVLVPPDYFREVDQTHPDNKG
jgi:S-DNA-T family DNA segregation ATPase FtsK/SpoIIIE